VSSKSEANNGTKCGAERNKDCGDEINNRSGDLDLRSHTSSFEETMSCGQGNFSCDTFNSPSLQHIVIFSVMVKINDSPSRQDSEATLSQEASHSFRQNIDRTPNPWNRIATSSPESRELTIEHQSCQDSRPNPLCLPPKNREGR
jgi:hypothetical protein